MNRNKRRNYNESIATLGDSMGVRERLSSVRELLSDGEQLGRPRGVPGAPEDPSSIAGMFAQESDLTEVDSSYPEGKMPDDPKEMDPGKRSLARKIGDALGLPKLNGFTTDELGGIAFYYFMPSSASYGLRVDQMKALLTAGVHSVRFRPKNKVAYVTVRKK